jgi:hypothetical protein
LLPPPDSPKIVTFDGSPPNGPMLSRTHSSAATMSSIPTLPELANSSASADTSRKPSTPSRWFTPTTTTSLLRARLVKS